MNTGEDKQSKNQQIKECFKFIQEELLLHSDIYEAFLASIESAVKEKACEIEEYVVIDSHKWSEHILKRIIGEE